MSTDDSTIEWIIHYHVPGGKPLKGRGEFLRLMLEDAQVPYLATIYLYGPSGIMDAFRGSPEAIDSNDACSYSTSVPPLLYPPALEYRRPLSDQAKETEVFMVNQVGACMGFLAEKLGYGQLKTRRCCSRPLRLHS